MRESMGNAGFRNIKENFLWEKIVDDFIDILKEKKLFTWWFYRILIIKPN